MDTGQIISGAGHAGLILWVLVGGFFHTPDDAPAVAVTSVSLVSSAEFDAMASAAPKPPVAEPVLASPDAQTDPVTSPRPVAKPATAEAPKPEPQPDTEANPDVTQIAALPEPEIIEAPEPIAPPAAEEQPMVVPQTEAAKPQDAPRVAPVPAEAPAPDAEIAETPTPAVAPDAVGEVVETPEQREAAPEAATTEIVTEATETDDAPSIAPTASLRPRQKPVPPARTAQPVEEQVAAAETSPPDTADEADAVDDAVAAALAEAVTETSAASGTAGTDAPAGPPMTDGEKDSLRVAVQQCWNVGSLSSDALRLTVTVGVSMGQNGVPDAGSIRMIAFEGGSEAAARQAYEAARRAIIICGKNGFPLPVEKYDQWRDIEMVFNPERMRIK